ncbi:MAG: response regulator transcription factor [Bacteroidetes bacterium]|nr:response regulator transcription factor [Bacteroidota bacterium]
MALSENTILLVDDEPDILEFISYNLKKNGYRVYTATNGKEALQNAREFLPSLIILDVMMPEMDGIETCEEIRKIPELKNTIIAILSAIGEDYTQIAGFEAGADDFIKKPIKPSVLSSRVSALLRRSQSGSTANSSVIRLNDIIIDKDKYLVIKNGKEIILPKKEFELLSLLTSKPDKVFTREDILSKVWGSDVVVGDRTIDVHVRKIREKIGIDNIKTYKGIGYSYLGS